jgi:hypothetical protein
MAKTKKRTCCKKIKQYRHMITFIAFLIVSILWAIFIFMCR